MSRRSTPSGLADKLAEVSPEVPDPPPRRSARRGGSTQTPLGSNVDGQSGSPTGSRSRATPRGAIAALAAGTPGTLTRAPVERSGSGSAPQASTQRAQPAQRSASHSLRASVLSRAASAAMELSEEPTPRALLRNVLANASDWTPTSESGLLAEEPPSLGGGLLSSSERTASSVVLPYAASASGSQLAQVPPTPGSAMERPTPQVAGSAQARRARALGKETEALAREAATSAVAPDAVPLPFDMPEPVAKRLVGGQRKRGRKPKAVIEAENRAALEDAEDDTLDDDAALDDDVDGRVPKVSKTALSRGCLPRSALRQLMVAAIDSAQGDLGVRARSNAGGSNAIQRVGVKGLRHESYVGTWHTPAETVNKAHELEFAYWHLVCRSLAKAAEDRDAAEAEVLNSGAPGKKKAKKGKRKRSDKADDTAVADESVSISLADVEDLFYRQELVKMPADLAALARTHLPREYYEEVIAVAGLFNEVKPDWAKEVHQQALMPRRRGYGGGARATKPRSQQQQQQQLPLRYGDSSESTI